ncbi:ABC transporter permease subunit [Fictibacillus nanhaiensis]|uniref:ABC transporter permease n=1 Tax=Fictibacillus nanhaiensis TaxID=742169 RepID=UPI001C9647BD|nr:ABC transporter permease subunit [Fictibacillus nanhaiensis]MBY6038310.1 ABC transporter permease subunit [Fictibacillus nanhaiensis]
MIRNIWKEPFFLIGFVFIAGLLAFSLYHQFVMDNYIKEEQILYDEEGTLIDRAPFEPSPEFWFGSDRIGGDLFYEIISGAKYTLGIAFIGSFLRIALSFLGGILLLKTGKTLSVVRGISQASYYMPAALLVYFILGPIIAIEQYTFWEKVIFELLIIVLLAIPNTSILIKEEISLIEREEFVTCAKLMGGNPLRILFKHIMPHLWPKLLLMYVQQVIAVLLLLAHLGILGIFFGGTVIRMFSEDLPLPFSLSNEWAGLLGIHYYQLSLAPWLVFFPVLSFAAVILAFNFMSEGLKRAGNTLPGRKKGKKRERKMERPVSENESFVFVNERKTG